jgi:ankyrin repeat protein
VALLLLEGANIYTCTKKRKTALDFSKEDDCQDIVRLLEDSKQ